MILQSMRNHGLMGRLAIGCQGRLHPAGRALRCLQLTLHTRQSSTLFVPREARPLAER